MRDNMSIDTPTTAGGGSAERVGGSVIVMFGVTRTHTDPRGQSMPSRALPFRLASDRLADQLRQFNSRSEIEWFGFHGEFEAPAFATLTISRPDPGLLGGGGTAAVNGGVIAAGFDGAFVLAGLGHYETKVVVTLELSVKFLDLAIDPASLAWRATVIRSSKRFAFVEAELIARSAHGARPVSIASGMVAPAA